MTTHLLKLLLLAALACGALPPAAHAVNRTWIQPSPASPFDLWTTLANWPPSNLSPGPADNAIFMGLSGANMNGFTPATIDQMTIGGVNNSHAM